MAESAWDREWKRLVRQLCQRADLDARNQVLREQALPLLFGHYRSQIAAMVPAVTGQDLDSRTYLYRAFTDQLVYTACEWAETSASLLTYLYIERRRAFDFREEWRFFEQADREQFL